MIEVTLRAYAMAATVDAAIKRNGYEATRIPHATVQNCYESNHMSIDCATHIQLHDFIFCLGLNVCAFYISLVRNQYVCLSYTKKAIVFFSLSLLFCLGNMKWVWFFSHTLAKLRVPLYMTVHKMLFIRSISNFMPLLLYELFAWKTIEKVSEWHSGTAKFSCTFVGHKKISLLWFWVWLDRIDACICRNRNEWWCNTVERIEMRLFIHKLYWHWRTSHSKNCIYPSDNDVAIIHVEAK